MSDESHVGAAPLNSAVMSLLEDYPEGGFGGYRWPARPGTHGTARHLYHGKKRIARAGKGTHCVGITFEVMWRALSATPDAKKRLTPQQVRRLRYLWFVPVDGGKGPAEALPAFKLGERIYEWDEARKGDFIQLWNRDRTFGHSAVFLDWVRDPKNEIVGVKFWSSQPWTEGIGVSELGLGEEPSDMDPESVFIARLKPAA